MRPRLSYTLATMHRTAEAQSRAIGPNGIKIALRMLLSIKKKKKKFSTTKKNKPTETQELCNTGHGRPFQRRVSVVATALEPHRTPEVGTEGTPAPILTPMGSSTEMWALRAGQPAHSCSGEAAPALQRVATLTGSGLGERRI